MDNSFLHSKKLLLVDDEPELLKMVSAILTDEGFLIISSILFLPERIHHEKSRFNHFHL